MTVAVPPLSEASDPVPAFAEAALEQLVAVLADDVAPQAVARSRVELDDARAALRGALDGDLPFALVTQHAGLSAQESELLAVLVGAEHDERLQRLLVSLTQDRERHRVEVWMLGPLLDLTPAAVGPGSALSRAALVERVGRGAHGRTAIAVPPRVLWALWGDRVPDPALPAGLQLLSADLSDVLALPAGWDSVLVVGPDRVRRRQAALRALGAARCLATSVPTDPDGWAALVREATLAGTAVLLEVDGPLDAEGRRRVEAATHLGWALSSRRTLPLDDLPRRDWREVHADASDPTDAEWAFALGAGTPRRHHLSADQLDRMRQAMTVSGGDAETAYRRLTDSRIDTLARHVVPRAGWDDLVLSEGRKTRLRGLVDRYRLADLVYDGWGFPAGASRGLVAMFSGPSGTGKTVAAEVVAGALGLDMYRLDISSVVSKYIGETEKNLDELFDAASIGKTVLFFDEADSLFSKRTEVSDSHDRHANVETSYLLQRLERYDGIVVLATNYEKNIDEAFLRRVHVRVDFPMPTAIERADLWRLCLGPTAPMGEDVDLDRLVKEFELSGAGIRNAVTAAAFLAAARGTSIGMAHLVQGVAGELHKLGRMVTRERFGEWYETAMTQTS